MDWLEDFLRGVGRTAGSAANLAGTALKGTAWGRAYEEDKQRELQDQRQMMLLDARRVAAIQDTEERYNQELAFQEKYKDVVMQFQDLGRKAFMSTNEQQQRKAFKAVPKEQRRYWRTSRYGSGLQTSTGKTPPTKGEQQVKAIEDLAKIQEARDKLTDEEDNLTPDQAAYFQEAVGNVIQEGGFAPTPKTPKPGTNVTPSTEIDRRVEDRAAMFAPKVLQPWQDKNVQAPTVSIKDYFSGGIDPFANYPSEGTAARLNMQEVPEEISQKGTTPKTFIELGITTREAQQRFDELQKGLPDLDLQNEYQMDPAGYKKLFEALRRGDITTKEAIELIKQSQQ